MLERVPGGVGIDEAGRGPLAGPVVVAAVRLPAWFDSTGLKDSKKLSPIRREEIEIRIRDCATFVVLHADAQAVDRFNVLRATLQAMAEAYRQLGPRKDDVVLVDGNQVPPISGSLCRCEVDGDNRFAEIAAASILAKNARDRVMRTYARRFPGYGFDQHFGYSTREHLDALRRLGPCELHRRSFAPVSELVNQPCLALDG